MLKVNWKLWKGKNEYRGHSQGLVGLGAIVVQLSCKSMNIASEYICFAYKLLVQYLYLLCLLLLCAHSSMYIAHCASRYRRCS